MREAGVVAVPKPLSDHRLLIGLRGAVAGPRWPFIGRHHRAWRAETPPSARGWPGLAHGWHGVAAAVPGSRRARRGTHGAVALGHERVSALSATPILIAPLMQRPAPPRHLSLLTASRGPR